MTDPSIKKLKKILLVEDDDLTSSIYHGLLLELNVCDEIIIINDGDEALQFILKEHRNNTAPEIIFIDIKMMGLSGLELVEELNKDRGFKNVNSKVIILTSSSFPKDIKRAKELGVDDYIVKPLSENKIKTIIKKHFPFFTDTNFPTSPFSF